MKWVIAESDEPAAAALIEKAGLHPLIAKLMVNRGIWDPVAARSFLECDLSSLSSPAVFIGMDRAVQRIRKAVARGEKIVVYGDYDVDGVTAASLLYLAVRSMGGNVECYIPDRISEGYGLNRAALAKIKASGSGLVITVDCGISAMREAEAARTLELDLIITDHHEISRPARPETGLLPASESFIKHQQSDYLLPDAFSILHPGLLLPDLTDAIREQVSCLTGVGVAFKLAQALLGLDPCDPEMQRYLDLVTLGTIADVGRLTGENRVLVKHGLERLSLPDAMQRPGITALKQVSGLDGKKIGVGTVGFTLAPRINASGRLERADAAFRLLTTDSLEEARELASALDDVNRERQTLEERILEEATCLCKKQNPASTGAFVLTSMDWHPGVIGIVSSRLVDLFYRPTALISIKDGIGKGSARSIPGFDLYKGLAICSDLLLGFGGHKYAAGFTIAEESIPRFRERLGSLVLETVGKEGFIRTQIIDGPVALDELTIELIRDIERLAPFGQGNPEPRLGARSLEVASSRIVGNNHLKLRLRRQNGVLLDAIAFHKGDLLGKKIRDGVRLAAVFTPRLNTWNGSAAVELEIKDIKLDK